MNSTRPTRVAPLTQDALHAAGVDSWSFPSFNEKRTNDCESQIILSLSRLITFLKPCTWYDHYRKDSYSAKYKSPE